MAKPSTLSMTMLKLLYTEVPNLAGDFQASNLPVPHTRLQNQGFKRHVVLITIAAIKSR